MATTKYVSPILVAEVLLEAEECGTCGVIYGLSRAFIAARRHDGNWWHCPNGHRWQFSESIESQLKKEKLALEERLNAEKEWSRRMENDLGDERKKHAVTKGQLTKTRNRVQAGVCPDCNRHFSNVERHMQTKHPRQEG